MRLKGLFLLGVLLLSLLPAVNAGNTAYGVLSIKGVGEVTIEGVGTFEAPIALVLPAGNYTVKVKGDVELEARVFMNSSRLVEVEFRKGNPGELVEGNLTILGVKVTYDWWKNYPVYNSTPSLGVGRGCGGGWSPFYYTDRPSPMTLKDIGSTVAKLLINNTVMPCYLRDGTQDINGKLEYVFHTIVSPGGVGGGAVLKNVSFITPLSAVSVASDIQYVKGYVFNASAASMTTPFTVILPVIPRDVYNVTGTSTDGDVIRIEHIPRIDTYNLSVGANHTLLTAVIRLKPEKKYKINYSLKRALELVRVEEREIKLHRVEVQTEPEGTSLVINGTVLVRGTSPAVFYLPPGNYTVKAFANGTGAREDFSLPGTERLNLTLRPFPVTLVLNVTPGNASVAIDGEQVKNTSVTLSPGEHLVTVSAPGHLAENLTVVLAPNESKVLTVALKPLPILFVETEPGNATVIVGNATCTSPCRLTLSPGRYVITASLTGYENASTGVYLKAGENVSVKLTLRKEVQEKTPTYTPPTTESESPSPTPGEGPAPSSPRTGDDGGLGLKVLFAALVVGVTVILLRRR
ncbi:PEGA domain-containing protein [Thermococcus aciditolerans]|uniref:PEGA domain-containing protein n=1 Tax=Thermococcus aciditolerans TaxID=2598455 RepID=A0A5C0SKJ9_9EURY|nr:PEGA domain-containing protein [Thermococcus aciditolerans]QEK14861.1 PEGA domain-containing protein [Thermococcus aciditolerans]